MHIIIVNPISGNGRAGRIYRKLMKESPYKDMKTVTYHSRNPGHAEQLTRELLEEYSPGDISSIIVIGGDGTIHEVLNGLEDKAVPITLIPGGSGNDFARGNNISRNPRRAMKNIYLNREKTPYWLGKYKIGKKPVRKFVNCIGFGFDAVVAAGANQSKLKKFFNTFRLGTLNYVFSVIKQIFTYKPIHLNVELDGVKMEFKNCFLATINNQPYLGGGMKINPYAKNTDKELSLLVIDSIAKWKVLILFLTIFFGAHTRFKEVQIFKAREIKLSSVDSMPFQVDGETGFTDTCELAKETEPYQINGAS